MEDKSDFRSRISFILSEIKNEACMRLKVSSFKFRLIDKLTFQLLYSGSLNALFYLFSILDIRH